MKNLFLRSIKFAWSRKVWIVVGIIIAIAEIAIAWGPVDCVREDVCNYADGNGSWALDAAYKETGVCQKIRAEYSGILQTLGIVVEAPEGTLRGGNLHLTFSDAHNTVLYDTLISYETMNNGSYTYIEMGQRVRKGRIYYLTIGLDQAEDGIQPELLVCNHANGVKENKELSLEDTLADTQLLTSYDYKDALIPKKVLRILLLSVATAFFIAFPLPQNDWIRRGAAILVLLTMPGILGSRLELLTAMEGLAYPFALKWNVLIMYGVEAVLVLAFGSMKWGIIATDILLTVLYSANYFVFLFRGEALSVSDFTAIGTAAEVAGGYRFVPNDHLYLVWCLALLFGMIARRCKIVKKAGSVKKKIIVHSTSLVTAVILGCAGAYILTDTGFLIEKGFISISGFDRPYMYYYDGYLVATCLDIQNRRKIHYADYSEKRAEELLDAYSPKESTGNTQDLPNVILILNESFADLRVLGNLQISEENMPFVSNLTEDAVRGTLNVSVLGGGTANTEFEVLTGCSMGLLPASYYPYMQCVKGPMDSLVSVMKDNGYTTYSMHPKTKKNWNRNKVYEYFGFDHSLWEEDFPNAQVIHNGVSDLETYKKVEQLFEAKGENEKLFVFDLTIQNHGDYETDPQGRAPSHQITATNVSSPEADEFLSLMAESDDAFSQLVEYFEHQEEKTIICMFGDHQPKFSDENFYDSVYAQTPGLTEEEKRFNIYRTPFVIWANYDIEEQSDLDISANYLGGLLLQTAGIQGNAYFNYLDELRQEYPVITVNGYKDSEGNIYQWSGQMDELGDYRTLQYKDLFVK